MFSSHLVFVSVSCAAFTDSCFVLFPCVRHPKADRSHDHLSSGKKAGEAFKWLGGQWHHMTKRDSSPLHSG